MNAKDFKPSRLAQMSDVTPMPTTWAWLVNFIKGDALKNNTEVYRQRLAELETTTDEAERKALKDQLGEIKRRTGGFFPHAVLQGGRTESHVVEVSNHIMVDIDKIPSEQFADVRQRLTECPYVFLLYTTYSGRGLRAIVRVDGDYGVKQFHSVWSWVNDYMELITGVPVDRQCGNINRFSGLAHDPNVFFNEKAKTFRVPLSEECGVRSEELYALKDGSCAAHSSLLTPRSSLNEVADRVKRLVESRGCYYREHFHNEYIYRCMYLMNNFGVPEDEAMQWALREFSDYPARSVQATVRCCYRKTSEHGTYNSSLHTPHSSLKNCSSLKKENCKVAKIAGENFSTHARTINNVDDVEVEMPQPPTFSRYEWPRLLRQAMDCGSGDAQRDLILIGTTTVLGASLSPFVRFLYGKRWMYPSLQVIAVAPPASGKGVLTWVRRLVEPIHENLLAQYRAAMEAYTKEKNAYDVAGKAKAEMKQPEVPPMRMFLIAGNNSATGVLENLMDANGVGLMCESEADTVSTAIGTDYGHWSDTLRKAFDHDRIAYNRRANREYREVGILRLSVLLSGTPAQVQPLIPSAENGLFSRQLFYSLPASTEWQSQFSATSGDDVDSLFKSWGKDWSVLVEQLRASVTSLTFSLSDSQRKAFDRTLSDFFVSASCTQEGVMKSWVTRLAINLMRTMSVVAFLRLLDDGWGDNFEIANLKGITPARDIARENVKDGTCTRYGYTISDSDFQAVMALARPLYLHANYALSLLPKTEVVRHKVSAADALLVELGTEFTTQQAIEAGAAMGMCVNTVRSHLHRLLKEGVIESLSHGKYVLARVCGKN